MSLGLQFLSNFQALLVSFSEVHSVILDVNHARTFKDIWKTDQRPQKNVAHSKQLAANCTRCALFVFYYIFIGVNCVALVRTKYVLKILETI